MIALFYFYKTIYSLNFLRAPHQNNNIDDGKMEEYERGLEEEKEATCQNKINRINTNYYHQNNTSKGSQEAEREVSVNEHQYDLNDEEEEEETRKSRTLDLFPVRENQEKTDATGLEEKNTKPNHLFRNYYYYYEFMPLMN